MFNDRAIDLEGNSAEIGDRKTESRELWKISRIELTLDRKEDVRFGKSW